MPNKQSSDPVLVELQAAIKSDKKLSVALKGKASAGEKIKQLQTRLKESEKQCQDLQAEMSELEIKRDGLLGAGKNTKDIDAEILEIQGRLSRVNGWCKKLENEDLPGALKGLEAAKAAVAVAVAVAMNKFKDELETRLKGLLIAALTSAEKWREAKAAVWQDLGINPDLVRGLKNTVIYLPDIAPELKDAYGTARAGRGY